MKSQTLQLPVLINKSLNNLFIKFENVLQRINRPLDSLIVLYGVSLLTFLVIRFDFTIQEIPLLKIILIFTISVIALFIKPFRNNLFWFGIFGIAFFILFQPINKSFPSLGSIKINQNISSFFWLWKFLLFPILYYLSILIYSIRSYLSKRKILLSFCGLLALLIGCSYIIDKLNPNNQITVKQIEQKSISVKPIISPKPLEKNSQQQKLLNTPQVQLNNPNKNSKTKKDSPKISLANKSNPQLPTLKVAAHKANSNQSKNILSEKKNILNQPNDIWLIKLKKPIILKSGDPLADLRLNPSVKPEALEREKMRLGLDQPLWKQYTLWLDGILVRGDLGLTQQGEAVLTVIKKPLANTLLLNLIVLIFTWLISIPLGLYAAIHKNKITDQIVLTLSSVSITTPSFLLTIFILAMAVKLGLGSVGGLTSVNFDELNFAQKFLDIASHLVLPVVILTFVSIGGLIRQMRGNLLDVLNEDYIKAALARGIPRNQVLWNHAMQNAINPLITLLGFEFAALVSGAALTEMILAYPGIGALTLEAARRMDVNLIMFNLLLGTIMLMLGNSFADWLLRKVDPRIRR